MADELECYLVGGAVRDELLGRPVVDRDWVVVGSSPEQMQALGFTPVGRDFPVFLHPDSRDEYALARTERKQGRGHRGFVVDADPGVTLEEDLRRRDLTINAMAKTAQGEVIDPSGGRDDLISKTLRHVSPAFAEDPLRVFRVARFAAQLPEFQVAEETLTLMRDMTAAGELNTLSAERVWQELLKALTAAAPERFFEVLRACDALSGWLPELAGKSLRFVAAEPSMRFAELPLNEAEFCSLAERLRVPQTVLQGALDQLQWGRTLLSWQGAPAADLAKAFERLKVTHASLRLQWLMDFLHLSAKDQQQLEELASGWRAVTVENQELSGAAYGKALRQARERWLDQARSR